MTEPTSPTKPRRRGLKIALSVVAGLLVLVLVLALLAPTLLSTGAGRGFIESKINQTIAGSVKLDGLSLAWFGGQRIDGLTLLDPEGNPVVTAKQVDAPGLTLASAVRGSLALGDIKLTEPIVTLVRGSDGQLNLARAVAMRHPAPPEPDKPAAVPADLSANVVVENGRVTYEDKTQPQMPVTELPGLNATLKMDSPASITADVKTPLKQGDAAGRVEADVQVSDLFDAAGTLTTAAAKIKGNVKLSDVPLAPVDSLANQGGVLPALLGPVLSADVAADGSLDQLTATIKADSANFATDIDANRQASGQLDIKQGSTVRLKMTPEGFAALMTRAGVADAPKLLEPFDITLDVAQLTVPGNNGAIDLAQAAVNARVALGDVRLMMADERIGAVALRGARASIESEGLARTVKLVLAATPEQGGVTGKLDFDATLGQLLTPDGAFNRAGMSALVNGAIERLPIPLVDALAGQEGKILAALGPTLDAKINANVKPGAGGKDASGTVHIEATSKNLAAVIAGDVADNTFTASEATDISLVVEPALFAKFVAAPADAAAGDKPAPSPTLLQPTRLHVDVTRLTTPLQGAGAGTILLSALVTLDDMLVDTNRPEIGQVSLHETRIDLAHDGAAQVLDAVVHTVADHKGRRGTVDATANLAQFLPGADGKPNPKMTANINGTIAQLPVVVADELGQLGGKAVAALGPILDAKLTAQLASADGKTYTGPVAVSASSQNLTRLALSGALRGDSLLLEDGSVINLTVTPELVRLLTTPADGGEPSFAIAEPMNVSLAVSHLLAPLDAARKKEIELAAMVTVDRLVPSGNPAFAGASLSDLAVDIPRTKLSDPLKVAIDGKLAHRERNGTINVRATVADPVGSASLAEADAVITTLPVALVDALAKQDGLLLALLGDVLDRVELKATPEADKKSIGFVAKVVSPNLNTDNLAGRFIPGDRLVLDQPGAIDLLVSPGGFHAYLESSAKKTAEQTGEPAKPVTLALLEPAKVRLAFEKLSVGLFPAPADPNAPPPPAFDPARTSLTAKLTSDKLALRETGKGQTMGLTGVNLTVTTDNLAKLLTVTLGAATQMAMQPGAQAVPGSITSTTRIENLAGASGVIDAANATIVTDTKAQKVPVAVLDALGNQNGQLLDLLGDEASLAVAGKLSPQAPGDWDLSLDSPNCKGSIPLTLDLKNDAVTLRDNAVIDLLVTPGLSKRYLSALSPLLNEARSGEKPVRLTLMKDGFKSAAKNFSLATLQGNGSLEIGTLMMRPGGLTKFLWGSEDFPADFTVLQFTAKDGVIESNDLWLSSKQLSMGTQARVYAHSGSSGEQMRADVILGIPGPALAKIDRNLAKYIKGDPVYELKTSGPINGLKPDFGALIVNNFGAIGESVGGEIGGAAAGLLGEVIGGIGKKIDKKPDAFRWNGVGWANRPKIEPPKPGETTIPEGTHPAEPPPSQVTPAAKPEEPRSPGSDLLDQLLKRQEKKK